MAEHEELNKIDITTYIENFLKTVKKFWLAMLIGTGLIAAAFYIYGWFKYVPMYESQATISVNTDASNLVSGGTIGKEQVKESFPYILQSQYMKNLVMDELELSYFPATVSLETKEIADFFVMKVVSADPQTSYDVLISILDNCPKASVYTLGKISLDVLDTSGVATNPINYLDKRSGLMSGLFVGAFLCCGLAFLYTLTNHTIQKDEDLKKYLSVSCLASLPQITFKKRRKKIDRHVHIYNDKVGFAFIETIRTLRTRVQRAMEKINAKVVLVTSSIPEEGKSTVASNLALSFAEKGANVILVDLDLRNPSINEVLGLSCKKKDGLADVLKGEKAIEENISYREDLGIYVLTAGEPQNNPMELVSGEILGEVIEWLREEFDYVILDTPPAAMLTDASAIAKHADCAVYVVKQDYARIERIVEGMEALTLAQLPILGVVLNGMEKVIGGYGSYRYGKYGSYGNYGAYGHYAANSEDMPDYIDLENPWENE